MASMDPNILVAYDFGDASQAALAWATDLHRSIGGPPIHVLHVVNPVPVGAPELVMTGPSEEEIGHLRKQLADAVAGRGMDAVSEVLVDPSIASTVIHRAEELGCNLIVMGTHGRSPLARALLGSIAQQVVQRAPCPVVTVRAGSRARTRAA